jgi:hypothetical protein
MGFNSARADIGILIGRNGESINDIISKSGISAIQTPKDNGAPVGVFEVSGRRVRIFVFRGAPLCLFSVLDLLRGKERFNCCILSLNMAEQCRKSEAAY